MTLMGFSIAMSAIPINYWIRIAIRGLKTRLRRK
jgi:hypothetical protein